MMKFVFALVLFYLCYNAQTDTNLNTEMISSMRNLTGNISFPANYQLLYPGKLMCNKASSCVVVFIGELTKLLKNATVPEDKKKDLDSLQANLKELERQQGNYRGNNATCKMEKNTNKSSPFSQYIRFLQKLNSSKKN